MVSRYSTKRAVNYQPIDKPVIRRQQYAKRKTAARITSVNDVFRVPH